MRQIKFRAKRIDNGEWVYGHYHQIGFRHFMTCKGFPYGVEVDESTLGQFIGNMDKNEVEIFEGDIVDEFLSDAEDENYLYHGVVEFFVNGFALKIKDKSYIELKNTGHNLEVIGNVTDNKELLS